MTLNFDTELEPLSIRIPGNLKTVARKIAELQGITLTELTISGLTFQIQKSQEWLDLLDKAAEVAKA
jgi:hypothetical protein